MRIKIIVELTSKQIYYLDKIAEQGIVSDGYWQTFDFVLDKAVDEFIKKHKERLTKEELRKDGLS